MKNTLKIDDLLIDLECKQNKPSPTGNEKIKLTCADGNTDEVVIVMITKEQLKSLGDLFIAFSNRVANET